MTSSIDHAPQITAETKLKFPDLVEKHPTEPMGEEEVDNSPGYVYAVRSQADALGDMMSKNTMLHFTNEDDPDNKDMTRQEDKDSTDIVKMLSRFGVTHRADQPVYTEVDYNIDLQQALAIVQDAKVAYTNLPREIKDKYHNWREMLAGMEDGSLGIDLESLLDKKQNDVTLPPDTKPEATP